MDINFAAIEASANQTIEDCRFAINRVVNQYVIAEPSTGDCITIHGLRSFGSQVKIGDAFRTTSRIDAIDALTRLKDQNPGNSVVAGLEVTRLHTACAKQIETKQMVIATLKQNVAA